MLPKAPLRFLEIHDPLELASEPAKRLRRTTLLGAPPPAVPHAEDIYVRTIPGYGDLGRKPYGRPVAAFLIPRLGYSTRKDIIVDLFINRKDTHDPLTILINDALANTEYSLQRLALDPNQEFKIFFRVPRDADARVQTSVNSAFHTLPVKITSMLLDNSQLLQFRVIASTMAVPGRSHTGILTIDNVELLQEQAKDASLYKETRSRRREKVGGMKAAVW